MNSPSIVVEDLTKAYGGAMALDGVRFTLEGAGVLGYLGPNGAGKTTTLKILTALIRPSRGRALVNGIDVREKPRDALAEMGAVVETPEPPGTFTVRDSLELVGRVRGMSRESIADRISYFDRALELPPLNKRMATLSTGLRQRVVIAGTLLPNPPVILLDEPTNGLDPAERLRIRDLINELKGNHLVLMSSHLLGEVSETCDSVVFLKTGKVLLQVAVSELEKSSEQGSSALEQTYMRVMGEERTSGPDARTKKNAATGS
jgi:ABC-2 type transport system ATP-binding protein